MPTLVLTPRHTADAQMLWKAAVGRGWDVHRLATWRIPGDLRVAPEPFLYVEALFGPTLAEQLGVRLLDPAEDWLPGLPERYRRRAVRLSTLGEARHLAEPAFVKPPNDKSFPAAVYEPGELPAEYDERMPVLVSEPVWFTVEFRCFVLQRSVRAFSLYARDGELTEDAEATDSEVREMRDFTATVLADPQVEVPRACVLDCGMIAGRGWGVVELNAAWGAGIYQCNPDAVLDVVRAATVPGLE